MKVLVTGAGGMLAQAVVPALEAAGHVVTAHARATLDVTRLDDVRRAVDAARPDWVCHLAAYTNVDGCESDVDQAFLVNGVGAQVRRQLIRSSDVVVAGRRYAYNYRTLVGQNAAPRQDVRPSERFAASVMAQRRARQAATAGRDAVGEDMPEDDA